jgi:hypothetical protein
MERSLPRPSKRFTFAREALVDVVGAALTWSRIFCTGLFLPIMT